MNNWNYLDHNNQQIKKKYIFFVFTDVIFIVSDGGYFIFC